jgi:hypothetical protein
LDTLLREAGMGEAAIEAVASYVLGQLAARMDGIQLLLTRWTPRPAVQPDEQDDFYAALDDAIEEQIRAVVENILGLRSRAEAQTQTRLRTWQNQRDAASDKPSVEARREMGELKPEEKPEDTMAFVELGGGQFTTTYTPRANPDDDRLYERISRQRAQKGNNND